MINLVEWQWLWIADWTTKTIWKCHLGLQKIVMSTFDYFLTLNGLNNLSIHSKRKQRRENWTDSSCRGMKGREEMKTSSNIGGILAQKTYLLIKGRFILMRWIFAVAWRAPQQKCNGTSRRRTPQQLGLVRLVASYPLPRISGCANTRKE